MPKYPDHYATVDGLSLRYWDVGSGIPILLIHGLGVTLETWAYNISALAESSRVVAVDLPGCGRSSRALEPDQYSAEYAARLLKRLAEMLGIDCLSICGNSMGGLIAIEFALLFHQAVDKLILVDSAGLGREISTTAKLLSMRPVGELIVRPTRPFIRQTAKHLIFREELVTEDFVNLMYEVSQIAGTKEAMLASLRAGVNLTGQIVAFSESELSQVGVPTLVVWGANDPLIPVHHAANALRAFPDCRVVVFNRAGHPPQMDRAHDFNQIASEFLRTGKVYLESEGAKGPFLV
jgi:4,5:9,10-diseco-3-hydroxy-5,9,17-trioxoandrosta-1(10),2-diene-4-oate hydrolase